jgi:hypothetical protein
MKENRNVLNLPAGITDVPRFEQHLRKRMTELMQVFNIVDIEKIVRSYALDFALKEHEAGIEKVQLHTTPRKPSSSYNSEMSLDEIANFYHIDKGTADARELHWHTACPTHVCHHYTTLYAKYMNEYREKKVKLIELGISDGRFPLGSLKMWLAYFKDVELFGLDNNPQIDPKQITEMGGYFGFMDQGVESHWGKMKKMLPTDFDFFIEDGSHAPNDMMYTLYQSIDMVKKGGYYFMEDIMTPENYEISIRHGSPDSTMIYRELLNIQEKGLFNTQFLSEEENKSVQDSYELVELFTGPHKIVSSAVFRKK